MWLNGLKCERKGGAVVSVILKILKNLKITEMAAPVMFSNKNEWDKYEQELKRIEID